MEIYCIYYCFQNGEVLGAWDRFRTFEWVEYVETPSLILKQAEELLDLIEEKTVNLEA